MNVWYELKNYLGPERMLFVDLRGEGHKIVAFLRATGYKGNTK